MDVHAIEMTYSRQGCCMTHTPIQDAGVLMCWYLVLSKELSFKIYCVAHVQQPSLLWTTINISAVISTENIPKLLTCCSRNITGFISIICELAH
jgi:hypothetical protein